MWVALMAFGWGAASILQAAASNFAGLMALRCIIGVFEAGFAPGVALFLSFFYHRSEMGFRYGLFISFSPIAIFPYHLETSFHYWYSPQSYRETEERG